MGSELSEVSVLSRHLLKCNSNVPFVLKCLFCNNTFVNVCVFVKGLIANKVIILKIRKSAFLLNNVEMLCIRRQDMEANFI